MMTLENNTLSTQEDPSEEPFVLKFELEVNTKDTYVLDISTSHRIEMEF